MILNLLCWKEELGFSFVLQNCLYSLLEHIAVYGQAVSRLQRFIDEVTGYSSELCPPGSGSSHSSRKGSEPPFRTYQAFVWALNKYFTSFKEELTTIERELISNGKSSKLTKLGLNFESSFLFCGVQLQHSFITDL